MFWSQAKRRTGVITFLTCGSGTIASMISTHLTSVFGRVFTEMDFRKQTDLSSLMMSGEELYSVWSNLQVSYGMSKLILFLLRA